VKRHFLVGLQAVGLALLLCTRTASAQERQPNYFRRAVEGVFALTRLLNDAWSETMIGPGGRHQATVALGELSFALDTLAQRKMAFATAIVRASHSNDRSPALDKDVASLQSAIRTAQLRVNTAFTWVPAPYSATAGKVQHDLTLALYQKATTIEEIARMWGLPEASVAAIRADADTVVTLTVLAKLQVDSLRTRIATPKVP
jgi:hypothetical protein